MEKLLVSRCLLGHKVRYDGGAHGPYDLLQRWQDEGRIVALCPEVAGGLPTPRPPAEIPGGQGGEVIICRVKKARIDSAVREQSREADSAGTVVGGEDSTQQQLAITLQHYGIHRVIWTASRSEGRILKTVFQEPCNARAR